MTVAVFVKVAVSKKVLVVVTLMYTNWLRSYNRANSATNARTRIRVSTFMSAVTRVCGLRRDLILA